MQLHSLVEPVYFPETDQQSVIRLGLTKLSINQWLHIDLDFPQFLQHKLEQEEARKDKVFAETEQSRAAQAEFCHVLKAHLLKHWPDHYQAEDDRLVHLPSGTTWSANTTSLWDSSLWIQDDVCLLENSADNHVMTAASLCSPSNWKLEDKIGESVDWIHQPVPGYQEQLAVRVNKLLAGLKPMKPVLRFNWSVQRGNELCWREDVTADGGENYFWRVERQTLIRLPETGAIVFAIRLFLHSFNTMNRLGAFNANLATVIARQSDSIREYKELDDALLKRLQGKE